MIYVSHRLDEIFRIADRVVVMRDGRLVGEKPVRETNPDELIGLIVGRSTFELFHKSARAPGRRAVAVSGPRRRRAPARSTSTSARGELLGLVGLRGAGQEEIGRALFGAMPASGRHPARRRGAGPVLAPRGACAQASVCSPATEAKESVASALAVRENLFLNPGASDAGSCPALAGRRGPQGDGARRSARLQARTSPELPIEGLSGGNQQKVVVGPLARDRRRGCSSPKIRPPASTSAPKRKSTRLIERALDEARGGRGVDRLRGGRPYLPPALVFNRGRIIAELSGRRSTTELVIAAASASEAA